MPMSPDDLMDTGDYELYNPRVQGLRARETAPMIRSIDELIIPDTRLLGACTIKHPRENNTTGPDHHLSLIFAGKVKVLPHCGVKLHFGRVWPCWQTSNLGERQHPS